MKTELRPLTLGRIPEPYFWPSTDTSTFRPVAVTPKQDSMFETSFERAIPD